MLLCDGIVLLHVQILIQFALLESWVCHYLMFINFLSPAAGAASS